MIRDFMRKIRSRDQEVRDAAKAETRFLPMEMDPQFTVAGWTYRTSDEHSERDVKKLTHWATQGNFAYHLEWSPYRMMTVNEFRLALETKHLI